MRILGLIVFVLLAGTVEAGDYFQPCNTCTPIEGGNGDLVQCTLRYCVDSTAIKVAEYDRCYQRMQEAMKAMDREIVLRKVEKTNSFITDPILLTSQEKQQWSQTMAECVK